MAFLTLGSQAAHADLGFWSGHLVGVWKQPVSGDVYRFNSNATYSFTPKAKKTATHSGWWKVVMPTEAESGGGAEGPVAVRLKLSGSVAKERRLVVDALYKPDHVVDKRYYRIGGVKWVRVGS
ncbi:hypothetical protein EON80_28050 [bacterium]|nr:MAG: hypothetical protein EON80_28050 [bacterium]